MQIVLDMPETLAEKLHALPNPQQFVIELLTQSLDGAFNSDQWWILLEDIASVAVDTEVTDLATLHDRYLGTI